MTTTNYDLRYLRDEFEDSRVLRTWCTDDLEQIHLTAVDDLLETFGNDIDIVRTDRDMVETFEIADLEGFMSNMDAIDTLYDDGFIGDDLYNTLSRAAYCAHDLLTHARSKAVVAANSRTVNNSAPLFRTVLLAYVADRQARPYNPDIQFEYFVDGVNNGLFIHA